MPYVAERSTQTIELHWFGRHDKVLRIRQFFLIQEIQTHRDSSHYAGVALPTAGCQTPATADVFLLGVQ
jgi:hypothetical protein